MIETFVATYVRELRDRGGAAHVNEDGKASAFYMVLASELEARLATYVNEELTYAQAATESGYSEDSLRKLVAAGQWSKRRRDLPRRPRRAGAWESDT